MRSAVSYQVSLLLFRRVSLLLLLAVLLPVAQGQISDECRNETAPLLEDQALAVAQSVVLEDYNASFYDRCEFGFSGVGCEIKFEGDDRTYNALCDAAGGQIYELPVVLTCAFGAITHDLGFIPTCVGVSCNVTSEVGPDDVETEQVEKFLESLKLTGCSTESSGGVYAASFREMLLLAMATAILIQSM